MKGMNGMTEQEWLNCTEPQRMLDFLRGKASDRRLRLFACACCRRVWYLLTEGRGRTAVEIAERYLATDNAYPVPDNHLVILRCENESENLMASATTAAEEARASAAFAALKCLTFTGEAAAEYCSAHVVSAVFHAASAASAASAAAARVAERGQQARLLHELFGNPFCPISMDPHWFDWNDATIVRLAQAAHDERILPAGTLDNTRLLILADALEEAGCTDEQILTHLRGASEHYRGCWVLDALLGRKRNLRKV
jgi:hypothetical protein